MKSLKRIPPLLTATLVLLTACLPSASAKVARSALARETKPEVPPGDLAALVEGDNTFALNLYGALRTGTGNIVFSPYSISAALAMTYAGASGATQSQMAHVLHFTLPQERLHPTFNQLDLTLTQEGKLAGKNGQPLQLDIANSLWAEQTFNFQQSFLDLIARNYGAGVRLVDFVNRSQGVRDDINQWVGDQTHQKIRNLIPAGALDPMTRLVLVNAIYFNADWENQFDPTDTKSTAFQSLDGTISHVKMMSRDFSGLPYSSGSGYQAVELGYLGDNAAMDILVPDAGNFDDFETQLTVQKLDAILGSMQPKAVSLGLPKFSFETGLDLGQHLSALGMPDAFDPDRADFSGMTGGRDLFISNVLHRALVTVDEKGTEAAAATSVILAPTSILLPQAKLTIDRPFIFIIRDIASRQILFIGRVLDPTK
jgi:serine protease inhibitor